MNAVRTRVLALLALLLVALPLGAIGNGQYFCHAMGRLMDDACCCRASHATKIANSPSGDTEIRAQDCCQRLKSAAKDSVPAVREGVPSIPTPSIAVLPGFAFLAPAPESHRLCTEPVQARAPPPPDAPIFLKNCSLLT